MPDRSATVTQNQLIALRDWLNARGVPLDWFKITVDDIEVRTIDVGDTRDEAERVFAQVVKRQQHFTVDIFLGDSEQAKRYREWVRENAPSLAQRLRDAWGVE